MTERPTLRRITALIAAVGAMLTGAAALGFIGGDDGWVPAWVVITALYGGLSYGLFRGRLWAPGLAQGVALFGAGAFAQCAFALWSAMPAISIGFAMHALLGVLALRLDDGLSKRQRWSLRCAGAALVPAALFALAPEQSGTVMALVLGASAAVWLGTIGVARGRTWGVLLALLGAPLLGASVALAPSLSWFASEHFLVADRLYPLMLDALGAIAAIAAFLAVAPFVGPMVRFVRS